MPTQPGRSITWLCRVAQPVGAASGGEITVQTWTQTSPPPPIDQNTFWQEFNTRLCANPKINIVPQNDYQAKLATALAGRVTTTGRWPAGPQREDHPPPQAGRYNQ